MAQKSLNTRIIHKHDEAKNWAQAKNFTPEKGELIVYDIDENYSYERFKIGDGQNNVASLPFVVEAITPEQIATVCGITQIYGKWAVL